MMKYVVKECSRETLQAALRKGKRIEFHRNWATIQLPGWVDYLDISGDEMTFELDSPWVMVDELGRNIDPTEGMNNGGLKAFLSGFVDIFKDYTVGFCQYHASANIVKPCLPDAATCLFVIERKRLSFLGSLITDDISTAECDYSEAAIATGSWCVKLPRRGKEWTFCWVFPIENVVSSLDIPIESGLLIEGCRELGNRALQIKPDPSRRFEFKFYEDDMIIEWASVVDETGRLVNPSRTWAVDDDARRTDVVRSDKCVWEQVKDTWMIVTFRRRCFSLESEYDIVQLPEQITPAMSDRLTILEEKMMRHDKQKFKELFPEIAFGGLKIGRAWTKQVYEK